MISELLIKTDEVGGIGLVQPLLDHMSDAVFILDRNLIIQAWNQPMAELTGFQKSEANGKYIFKLMPFLNGSLDKNFIHQALQGFTRVSMRAPYILPNEAAERYLEAKYTPLYNTNGNINFCLVVIKDLTSAKEYSQRILETEDRFKVMADSAPVLLWMAEKDGRYTFFNKNWFSFTGRSFENESGFGWTQGIHPDDFQYCMDILMAAISRREKFTREFRLLRNDGQYRWVMDIGMPRFISNNIFAGYIGSCVDITERKECSHERERLYKSESLARAESDRLILELENMNRLKDEFLATLSHELRTPLNAILGFSELILEQNVSPSDQKMALESIHRNAIFQVNLISDMLDLSKIVSGTLVYENTKVRLLDVIKLAVGAVNTAAQAKRIKIEIINDDALTSSSILTSGDSERLRQVFWNILTNAVRHTAHGGQISIKIHIEEAKIFVSIKDNGEGIDSAFLPFVFDRFRQADGSSTRRHGGLGVGLSIVKHLVELHGGAVAVHSEGKGKGAEFKVILPLVPV